MIELGTEIKKLRLNKGLDQTQVANKLGWKNPSILSRIETSTISRPKRSTLKQIANALNISNNDYNNLLFLGGYIPTDKEITIARNKLNKKIESWPFPSIVYDFYWRIIDENKHSQRLYYSSKTSYESYGRDKTNILKINFNPNFYLHKFYLQQEESTGFLTKNVKQFLRSTQRYSHQKWHKDLLKDLFNYPAFKKIYLEIQKNGKDDYEIDELFYEKAYPYGKPNKILHFSLFNQDIANDPRFSVEFFVPMDKQTYKYFIK